MFTGQRFECNLSKNSCALCIVQLSLSVSETIAALLSRFVDFRVAFAVWKATQPYEARTIFPAMSKLYYLSNTNVMFFSVSNR